MDKEYRLTVKENEDGELYIELPDELMQTFGWSEETSLVWVEQEDGSIVLKEEVDDSSNEA